jgi:hypothetical protein
MGDRTGGTLEHGAMGDEALDIEAHLLTDRVQRRAHLPFEGAEHERADEPVARSAERSARRRKPPRAGCASLPSWTTGLS